MMNILFIKIAARQSLLLTATQDAMFRKKEEKETAVNRAIGTINKRKSKKPRKKHRQIEKWYFSNTKQQYIQWKASGNFSKKEEKEPKFKYKTTTTIQ